MLRPNLKRLAPWLLGAALTVVCSAQRLSPPFPNPSTPPSGRPDNVAAVIVTMQGQVSVMRDSVPYALSAGQAIAAKQMVITGPDGYAVFQVDDGSTIEVYPNSKWTFRGNSNWLDLVDLWIGRIKVHIQRWGGQPNNQRIHTPTAVISVRGTTFDVSHDAEDTTIIEVVEGRVGVRHRLMENERDKEVNGGESLTVYKNVPLAKVRIDKAKFFQKLANILNDTFTTIGSRGTGGGFPGGSTGGGGTAPLPGDTGATPPPPLPGDTGATPPPPPPPGN